MNKNLKVYVVFGIVFLLLSIMASNVNATSPPPSIAVNVGNETIFNSSQPGINLTVTDVNDLSFACTLWFSNNGNTENVSFNPAVANNTPTTMTATTQLNGTYWYWISCNDGSDINTSNNYTLGIDIPFGCTYKTNNDAGTIQFNSNPNGLCHQEWSIEYRYVLQASDPYTALLINNMPIFLIVVAISTFAIGARSGNFSGAAVGFIVVVLFMVFFLHGSSAWTNGGETIIEHLNVSENLYSYSLLHTNVVDGTVIVKNTTTTLTSGGWN
jgi:hypothetical protein